MKETSPLPAEVAQALRDCLRGITFAELAQIEVEPRAAGVQPDLVARVSLPDGDATLVVEAKSSGQPRLARVAAAQLAQMVRAFPRSYGVFAAPYVSPASAGVCAQSGIGYLDLAGNCRLSFWPVHIERQGNPNPFLRRRDLRSLYTPKAARVLRVLLVEGNRSWRVGELARRAEVSLGQVSNVKRLLLDREWVEAGSDGLRLVQPLALLDGWAGSYDLRRHRALEFYSRRSAAELEADLSALCRERGLRYALTGFSGGARLAPAVRYQRAMTYLDEPAVSVIAIGLGLKPVPSGANFTVLVPYDAGVYYGSREIGGALVASDVQVYLDLLGLRGRGEEAAEATRRRCIEPRWR